MYNFLSVCDIFNKVRWHLSFGLHVHLVECHRYSSGICKLFSTRFDHAQQHWRSLIVVAKFLQPNIIVTSPRCIVRKSHRFTLQTMYCCKHNPFSVHTMKNCDNSCVWRYGTLTQKLTQKVWTNLWLSKIVKIVKKDEAYFPMCALYLQHLHHENHEITKIEVFMNR